MEREFLKSPVEFLRMKLFLETVSVTDTPIIGKYQRFYLRELKNRYDEAELRRLLAISLIGRPYISSLRYKTTFVRIQHLYQVSLLERLTGLDLLRFSGVLLDFGGGYGDMAALLYGNVGTKLTYVIVDLPILAKVQYLYLNAQFPGGVALISRSTDQIEEHLINIVPLNFLDQIDRQVDVFWSTYSLTETNFNVVNLLKKKQFFGARSYFIAYQRANEVFKGGASIASQLKDLLSLKQFVPPVDDGDHAYLWK
ncbi:putative sugar O-methyltransferase [Tardisphaera miroshnichenkoae]